MGSGYFDQNTGYLPQNPSAGGGATVGAAVGGATEGSVLFAGALGVLAQDNANFFWDDTNNGLAWGTSSAAQLGATIKTSAYPDVDSTHIFGRLAINSTNTDFAQISHFDQKASTTNYAFYATTAGSAGVNVASGQVLGLASAGSSRWAITGTAPYNFTSAADSTCVATGLGTAALPGYTFRGDLNNGYYSPAADTQGWATAGTKKMGLDTYLYIPAPAAAPTDGNLHASSIAWYLNEAGSLIHARVKYADGTTLKTTTVGLAIS